MNHTDIRQKYLEELLNCAPDATVVLTQDGSIWHATDEFSKMFGHPLDKLMRGNIEFMIPERFRKMFRRYRKRYFAKPERQRTRQRLESFGLHRDGHEFPIAVSISAIAIDIGIVVVCSVRDISEQHRHELILRESEARFRKLMEAAPDGIILSDAEGMILQANPQVEIIFGYDPGELIGLRVNHLMPERYQITHRNLLKRFLRDPKRIEMGRDHNLEGLRKDGTHFPLEININPILESDTVLVVSSLRNISIRRERENQLRLAQQQAEMANHAKSEFLSHMSHELRTPLNGILGYAQILQQEEILTHEQRRNVDSILQCGDHLLSLINDVLDLSKIEAGREELNLAPTDLHHLINEVSNILSPRAAEKELELEIEVAPVVPVGVMIDGPKLRQILVNLLGNALKFTEKGKVSLTVDYGKLDQHYHFRICDTGIGMKPEELEIIFDPFRQVEAGKAAGGTGLGLAICQRLAKMLQGSLTATSQVGQGSQFLLKIPLEQCALDGVNILGPQHLDSPSLLLDEATILIADDRETNIDILDQMLTKAGFKTLTADDGDTALEQLRKHEIDLVLMDVRMPRMSGIEAVEVIRKDAKLHQLKVIAVTASVFPDFEEKAIEAGFDDYLSKPFHSSDLMRKLANHLKISFTPTSEQIANPTQKEALEIPPSAAQELKAALAIRNLSKINAIISTLDRDPEMEGLATELRALAQNFDFEALENRC